MTAVTQNYALWAKQFGSVYKFSILSDVFVVISDPQEMLRLTSKQENVPKWHEGYRTIKQVHSGPSKSQLCTDVHWQATKCFDI